VAGNGEVALTWGTPLSDGGGELSGYRVLWSTDGTNWTLAATTTDPSNRAYTVTGLTNGLAYRFRVSAINAAGAGSLSVPRTATPQA
ncbi:MAG: fibronectin type III domain-containing protein, partial [Actinomycetota bacterium]